MMDEENRDQEINSQEPDFSSILDEIEATENTESSSQKTETIENTETKETDTEAIEENVIAEENIATTSQSEEITEESSFPSAIEENEANFEETSEEELITVRPVKFQEFKEIPPLRSIKKNLDILQDISMHISVELGRTKSSIKEIIEMEEGSIVELEKIAGEQVEVYVNERLVAKGEVIVIEDKFGVRITSTSLPKNIE